MAEKEEILSKRIENQTEALRLANEKVLTQKGQLKALNSKIKKQQSELEKKDKIIAKLKKHNKDLLRKLRNRIKEVKKLTKYSLYKREFTTLNKQLQQKDRIIDNISKNPYNELRVNGILFTGTDIKHYFERKVIPEEK